MPTASEVIRAKIQQEVVETTNTEKHHPSLTFVQWTNESDNCKARDEFQNPGDVQQRESPASIQQN